MKIIYLLIKKSIVFILLLSIILFFTNCSKKYSLSIDISPAGKGTVTSSPSGEEYKADTKVSLTAKPIVGYLFSEWSGDASGSLNPISIIMNSDMLITAIFEEGVFEDFNDGIADYFEADEPGLWSVSENAYKMSGINSGETSYSCYQYKFYDFEYSVDMKVMKSGEGGHAFGIYFLSEDENYDDNSYRLSIQKDGSYYIGKYVDGDFYFLTNGWIDDSDLNKGLNTINNIKIVFIESEADVYINNELQGTITGFSDNLSGYMGLIGYDSDVYDNEFVFDNFSIVTEDISAHKSSTVNNKFNIDITKIKGVKGDPNGNILD